MPNGEICGSTEDLEIHHVVPYGKRSRPNSKEYWKPKGKELRCKTHHKCTRYWGGRRKRMSL